MKFPRSLNEVLIQAVVPVISALIVLAVSETAEAKMGRLPGWLLAILVGGFLGLWISELIQRELAVRRNEAFINVTIDNMKQEYDEKVKDLQTDADHSRRTAERVCQDNSALMDRLTRYFAKLGVNCTTPEAATEYLDHLAREGDSLDSAFGDIVSADMHGQQHSYHKLRQDGQFPAKYRRQIDLARVLCRLSKRRFWATSTDRVSSFQMYNHYYYDALFRTAETLRQLVPPGGSADMVPPFARVFVGTLHSFAADLIDHPGLFFDLYKMHVLWGRKKDPMDAPVRFFLADGPNPVFSSDAVPTKQRAFLEQQNAMIADFMLVDDKFVYGREGDYSEDNVTLRLLTQKGIVDTYGAIFPGIWQKSIPIHELSKSIRDKGDYSFGEREHQEFVSLCKIAESKLDIHSDYAASNSKDEDVFPPESRIGEGFFHRLCHHIGNSENLIVAVDRADRKTGDVLQAWRDSYEYQAFHSACADAAKRGAHVCRLYVVEKHVKKAFKKAAIREFIERNARAGIFVGFVQAEKLPGKGLESEYMYDFILVNMPWAPQVFDRTEDFIGSVGYRQRFEQAKRDCLGFELLGNQSFIATALKWEDNLIAKDKLSGRLITFRNLWTDNHVVKLKGFQSNEIEELMGELS